MKRAFFVFALAGVLSYGLPGRAAEVGLVTGIQGEATVQRDLAPEPHKLHFKDNLFWQDVLNTGTKSSLRLFVLQKSVINMMEHSQLALREVAPTPAQPKKKSIVNLISGSARVVVEKEALKDNDYEIRTSRTVAAIRGSDVIGSIGGSLNNLLQRLGIRPVANDSVSFVTGPGSRLAVSDSQLGPTDMDELEFLTAGDEFTRQNISLGAWETLANAVGTQGPQNPTHGPGGGSETADVPKPSEQTQKVEEKKQPSWWEVLIPALIPQIGVGGGRESGGKRPPYPKSGN